MSKAPRVCARPVLADGSQGDADTYVLASDYAAVTRERDDLLRADSRWSEIVADELAESRRLMDLGGAKDDENFTTFAERVIAERDALRAEVERERMRLVACGVVANANTPATAAEARKMHDDYRSASCDDVARAVDREMALRAEVEALRGALHSLAAVARRYLPDYDEHPEIQRADAALTPAEVTK